MADVRPIEFVDPDGQKMRMFAVGDVILPPMPGLDQNIDKLLEFKLRDDDVILTTYPRSGTHFMWEIIRMLRRGSSEYIKGEKETEFLELFHINGMADLEDRVINTHLPPELLPVDWKNRKCKFIHVFRNPKDVMVSLYNHWISAKEHFGYDGKFSGFFELAMKGQVESGRWFDYELKYEEFFKSNPGVSALVLSFEDLKEDPVTNIKKVSEFLGLSRDDKLIASIADAVSFSKMKAGKFRVSSELLKQFMSDEMYNKMYRKGAAGEWKNWFTVSQNERYNAEFEKYMNNSSLKARIKFEL